MELRLKKSNALIAVVYDYHYEKGLWSYPNGDPGVPSSEEIDIKNIEVVDGNLMGILVSYNKCQDIIDEIEERISEYERNGKD